MKRTPRLALRLPAGRLLSALWVCALAAAAPAVPIDLVIIGEVNGSLAATFPPAVNNAGVVAFSGTSGQTTGVFVGSGDGMGQMTVFPSNPSFSQFGNLAINNNPLNPAGGDVAFLATGASAAILLVDDVDTKTIVDITTFTNFNRQIGLNDSGEVALVGATGGVPGVYVGDGVNPALPVATMANGFTQFLGGAAINNSGEVAFIGASTTAGPAVFLVDGTPPPTEITGAGGASFSSLLLSISLNDNGAAAFAGAAAGLSSIFSGIGTPADTVADVSGPFLTVSNPAIDNAGNIAFLATLDAGGEGVFVGADPTDDTLVSVGDMLDGATITDLEFGPNGLANGRIAFAASLDDGRTVIVRGDFAVIPEPATVAMAGLGLLAAFPRRRR